MEIIVDTPEKHIELVKVRNLKFDLMLKSLKTSVKKGENFNEWTITVPMSMLMDLMDNTTAKNFNVNVSKHAKNHSNTNG